MEIMFLGTCVELVATICAHTDRSSTGVCGSASVVHLSLRPQLHRAERVYPRTLATECIAEIPWRRQRSSTAFPPRPEGLHWEEVGAPNIEPIRPAAL